MGLTGHTPEVRLPCLRNLKPGGANGTRKGKRPASYMSGGERRRGCAILVNYSYMPSEPHGEGDIAVELWKKLEPGEK